MTLKEQINDDLKTALLGGNKFKSEVLRSLKAVILNEEVAKGQREKGIDDVSIQQLIAREVKKRNETAEIYKNAQRTELAENELSEAKIMSDYLPKQLSEAEINSIIKKVIDTLGVSGISGLGHVIGAVKKEVGNSADGAVIAKLVKIALS